MSKSRIFIKGARVHNLKNIDVEIPRNKLIVITGLSGSGKSSLAFDTIYAEGQRRYIESLSSYARQFLQQMQKPDVDYIEGLSPSVSIEQRTAGANPRSTVGTATEIYDYLRLLFAKVGRPHCYKCGRPIRRQTSQEITDRVLRLPRETRIQILAPLVRGRKGEYHHLFARARKEGYVRVKVDGKVYDLAQEITLDKKRKHNISVIVDRLIVKPEIKSRLTDSIETALKLGEGIIIVSRDGAPTSHGAGKRKTAGKRKAGGKRTTQGTRGVGEELLFSELYACVNCGINYEELAPRMFSFNSPYGACKTCDGLGTRIEIDKDLVVPDKDKSIQKGAIAAWRRGGKRLLIYYHHLLRAAADYYGFSIQTPFKKLPKRIQEIILHGSEDYIWGGEFEGVIPNLERRFEATDSEFVKEEISKYMSVLPCPACLGARLRPESLAVTIEGRSIWDATRMSISQARGFFERLELSPKERIVARQILKEIRERLKFMTNVGLNYLTLDRTSGTLSGGEAQRIRLATQIGAGLVGVLYVLDEPSIGLHQRDNRKLLDTLKVLRDLGNTLILVEHDEATIRTADYIIDLGPGAGAHGGEVVISGTLENLIRCRRSLTGQYLRGELQIEVPSARRPYRDKKFLKIEGAAEHNLKDIDVEIPLGLFTCVTGVSGSGKSTLVDEILYRALAQRLYRSRQKPGRHKRIVGQEFIDKVIVIDQSPIGRTPRSNPATYTGVFTYVRELFSRIPEARIRGYTAGRFSFNVKGGRCEFCQGDGIIKIQMHFLPDVYVPCEVCKEARFNRQTLEVKYKGRSIKDVLELKVEEALELFKHIPRIRSKLQTLYDVGLGYIQLGQSATTLSGGEAQRVKLSTELSKRSTGRTFYILDEPTTGLHFADIDKLLAVLKRLVQAGNTVLVIEHNLDVIKSADYIIDLGPEGGDEGGKVVATGTPEEVARVSPSYTGQFLKKYLKKL